MYMYICTYVQYVIFAERSNHLGKFIKTKEKKAGVNTCDKRT